MTKRLLLLLLLLLPSVALTGMIGFHYLAQGSAPSLRLPIEGYDPRDYFEGHYLRFRLKPGDALVKSSGLSDGPYKYYLSEDGAKALERVLRKPDVKASVLVHIHKQGQPSFSDLWIDETPWRAYLKERPATE